MNLLIPFGNSFSMNKTNYYLLFSVLIALCSSCSGASDGNESKGNVVRQLVTVGYSIKELSIRTDYPEETLIKAFHGDNTVLDDSTKNEEIAKILRLNYTGGIIPVNKCDLSAYNALWKIYEKAQNLPRVSLFTGIGVTKVGNALMKRKSLDDNDSIRALVGYVNTLYNLGEMPPSVNQYYNQIMTLSEVVVPLSYHSLYADQVSKKVDYYLYLNEQYELRANNNLKTAIQSKLKHRINDAVDTFISEDLHSLLNTVKSAFKDSLEKINYYGDKLSKRLALEELESDIKQEVLSYYVSVCCSRALLVDDVLHYRGTYNRLSSVEKYELSKYVAQIEETLSILEMQQKNLAVDSSINVGALVLCAFNPPAGRTGVSIAAIAKFVTELLAFEGLDHIVKRQIGFYSSNEDSIASISKQMSERIVSEFTSYSDSLWNSEGGIYVDLNKSTKDYYNNIRNVLQIN